MRVNSLLVVISGFPWRVRHMRRPFSFFVVAAVLLNSMVVSAGCPNPETSSVVVTGQGSDCQFRFRQDGGLDEMTVSVVVRDAFTNLLNHTPTTITLVPNTGTLALCSCDLLSRTGFTDMNGEFAATFSHIGGRGSLDVSVSVSSCGNYELGRIPIQFTSPDLNASCEPAPASAVNVVDLGIWASGLPPNYLQSSDFDCSAAVNVIDLGIWAGGLGQGCGTALEN